MYPNVPHEEDVDSSHYRVEQLIDMGFPEDDAIFQVKSFIRSWRLSPTPTNKWLNDTTENTPSPTTETKQTQSQTQPNPTVKQPTTPQ
jgi:hypothetical protein